ncbi:MAG: TlyA family RNA methyltransferase [bacterium]
MKYRLDELLVLKKLVESRIKAQKLILDGKVKVNGQVIYKISKKFPQEVVIEVENPVDYVSRGGYKLEKAITEFSKHNFSVEGKVCLDIGASTGGFTECLLNHKAKFVIALDNGKSQLHPKLLKNPNVINIEKFNAKNIHLLFQNPTAFGINLDIVKHVEIIVIDVSFISLTHITQPLTLIDNKFKMITLIKPNFELTKQERKYLKKGVLRDRKKVIQVLLRTLKTISKQGYKFIKVIESPIKGYKGNTEFLAYFIKEK